MTLEELLKPVKVVDEEILRQYTKISKKFSLDEGKKRYVVANSLWFVHVAISISTGKQLFGPDEASVRTILNVPDFGYSFNGMIGGVGYEMDTGERAINPILHFYNLNFPPVYHWWKIQGLRKPPRANEVSEHATGL